MDKNLTPETVNGVLCPICKTGLTMRIYKNSFGSITKKSILCSGNKHSFKDLVISRGRVITFTQWLGRKKEEALKRAKIAEQNARLNKPTKKQIKRNEENKQIQEKTEQKNEVKNK